MATAISKEPVVLSVSANKVLQLLFSYYENFSLGAPGSGQSFSVYLTTNNTIPTDCFFCYGSHSYDPIYDKSVALVFRAIQRLDSNSHVDISLLFQRKPFEPIADGISTNCSPTSTCYLQSRNQTWLTASPAVMQANINETSANGVSNFIFNGAIPQTTTLPWLDINQNYYIGLYDGIQSDCCIYFPGFYTVNGVPNCQTL